MIGNGANNSDEGSSIPPSQVTTNGRNTPRTISPSPYDLEYRTESPSTTQGAFDLHEGSGGVNGQPPAAGSSEESGGNSRTLDRRIVAFNE